MSEALSAFAVYKNRQVKENSHAKKKFDRKIRPKIQKLKKIKSKNQVNGMSNDIESDSEIPELVSMDDTWIEKSLSEVDEKPSISDQTNRKRKKKHKSPSVQNAKKRLKTEKTFNLFQAETANKSKSTDKDINFDVKARKMFEWLISPTKTADFFEIYWEKKPLVIKRRKNIYKHILSTAQLDSMLRQNSLFFTRNVDVVQYIDDKKEKFNIEGRAYPSNLWNFYNDGRSIRILNPQTYNPKIHQILAALQEFFGTMAGANVYLTPPGSQGFAPHYDDIEAFIIQLEGRKHWKLYGPRNQSDILPRYSSQNFTSDDLTSPVKEVTLEAGDLMYFPRGVIHEGYTDEDSHSLHITISVYQRTSYADLLEYGLKAAIKVATEENPQYRKGLPINYLKHVGLVNSDNISIVRETIITTVKTLVEKLSDYFPLDAAADQLGKQFMWDALPPILTEQEKNCSVHENGEVLKNGVVDNRVEFDLDTKIRLIRYYCLRMLIEEDAKIRLYYSVENAKVYHDEELQYLEIEENHAPAVERLILSYPAFTKVSDLLLEDDISKIEFATVLWERGLIITESPLSFVE